MVEPKKQTDSIDEKIKEYTQLIEPLGYTPNFSKNEDFQQVTNYDKNFKLIYSFESLNSTKFNL